MSLAGKDELSLGGRIQLHQHLALRQLVDATDEEISAAYDHFLGAASPGTFYVVTEALAARILANRLQAILDGRELWRDGADTLAGLRPGTDAMRARDKVESLTDRVRVSELERQLTAMRVELEQAKKQRDEAEQMAEECQRSLATEQERRAVVSGDLAAERTEVTRLCTQLGEEQAKSKMRETAAVEKWRAVHDAVREIVYRLNGAPKESYGFFMGRSITVSEEERTRLNALIDPNQPPLARAPPQPAPAVDGPLP